MSDPTYPTETSAAEPPKAKPSRGRRVLAGAALVAAGLVAGGGATYAVASQINPASPEGTSTAQPGERAADPAAAVYGYRRGGRPARRHRSGWHPA